jgi:CRISPR-associated protein Cas1
MINETLYCERLAYLEWAQGEFADNQFTVDGRYTHRRTDNAGGQLPPIADPNEPQGAIDRPYKARSVWLSSESLGITAKIDVVEGDATGSVVPIEYKRGEPPDAPEGAYLPERAQVCAQVLLLREHGYRVDHGELYFASARRRVTVTIDDVLAATTIAAAKRARELCGTAEMPPPLVESPKCNGCSLVGICLPDETNLLRGATPGTGATEDDGEDDVVRQLHPARDDRMPLYVQEQGARIGLSAECLVVRSRDGRKTEVRLAHTSHVSVFGNVQISTQAIRTLLERSIPVVYFSTGGWYYGRMVGHDPKNVELRLAQLRAAADPARCLAIARGLIGSKVRNCRTMLRRNCDDVDEMVLDELERSARKAERACSLGELLGIEGTAARLYFGSFAGMLKARGIGSETFDLDGRNRRPPKDPVNALLSFAYSLLARDFAAALAVVGLDPMIGFYHQPRFGRPSLALDLMEEFRPLVADSIVLSAINIGVVDSEDFVRSPAGIAMTPASRKRLLETYERRMDQLVSHPVFGYRISYRRVIEVQARLLTRHLLDEIEAYPEFRTR